MTRPMGNVSRSCWRRLSRSSPNKDADSGVSTNPGATKLTRTGASSSASVCDEGGHRRRERGSDREAEARAARASGAHKQQRAARSHTIDRFTRDLQYQHEMLVDMPNRLREVHLAQWHVERTARGDHHVVKRFRQAVEKSFEGCRIECVEGGGVQCAKFLRGVAEAVWIAAGDNDGGALRTRMSGGFESNAGATANDHDRLRKELRRPLPGSGDR